MLVFVRRVATKFSALVDHGHFMHEECHSCIAKWHCSGGCMMFRRNYDNQKMQAVCRFTQRMTIRILLARLEHQRQQQRRSLSQLHKLTLLPTHRCNFKCTYCFSAKGRQNKTLSEKQAFAAIDYFIDRQRAPYWKKINNFSDRFACEFTSPFRHWPDHQRINI